jgi:hypothetical protein
VGKATADGENFQPFPSKFPTSIISVSYLGAVILVGLAVQPRESDIIFRGIFRFHLQGGTASVI